MHKLIKFLPGESVNHPSLDKILSYLRDNHLFYTDDYHIQANPALSKAFLEHIVNGNERAAIKLIAHDFPFYHSTLKVAFALDRKETIYAMTSKRLFNKTLTATEFTQELADRKKLGENLLTYVKNSKNSYIIKTLVDSLPELAKEIESFAYQQIQMDCQKAQKYIKTLKLAIPDSLLLPKFKVLQEIEEQGVFMREI